MSDFKVVTIRQFLFEKQLKYHPQASGVFTSLLGDIILASKILSREINKAGLLDILGYTDVTNIHGDEVQKLDRFANETFLNCLNQGGHVSGVVSEELDDIYHITQLNPEGNYILTLDPLDGSSNIDVNVSVGSIFGIYRRLTTAKKVSEKDFLQPGNKLVAAGYIIYGSSTMFVLSTGFGVHGFTLDPSVGEFLLSHRNIQMPQKGKYYSVNEANSHKWHTSVVRYIENLKAPKSGYAARYIGSLVADFHRNLLKGGVFLYPSDKDGKPKLRLLYEAIPMAFIAEQAGGEAIDGKQRILDVMPEDIHQRVGLFVGSKEEMQYCRKFFN